MVDKALTLPPPPGMLSAMARTPPEVLRNLIVFQSRRLKRTYADFVKSDTYSLLVDFFFNDVYSTEDKTERDEQFKRLYESFRRKLGDRITAGVGELVSLNTLSHELDLKLADAIWERTKRDAVDDETYEQGYRDCDNYDIRVKQIESLARSIRYFSSIAERFTIGLVLKTVTGAAALFGGSTVISFLNRGYKAYRSVTREQSEFFVKAVETRELARLNRIYGRPEWDGKEHW